MTSRLDAAAAAARRRAEEAARRAAEQKRLAAEQARKAAAAAAAKKATSTPLKSVTAKKLKKDEFSTGMGKALRLQELKAPATKLKIETAKLETVEKKPVRSEFALSGRGPDGFFDKVGRGLSGLGDLFGGRRTEPATPPSTLSPNDQAELDAERIDDLATDDPGKAADELKDLLEANEDPEYRRELIDATKGAVEDIARTLEASGAEDPDAAEVMEDLAEAAALVGPEGGQDLGEAFAKGLSGGLGVEHFENLAVGQSTAAQGLIDAMRETPGAGDFLAGMVKGASATENSRLSDDLKELTEASAGLALEAFGDASEDVNRLNGELAALVEGFGADADPADLQEAIENFKETHEEEYERFEAAGVMMANVIDAAPTALEEFDDFDLAVKLSSALQKAPQVAQTEAGREALARALEAQSQGDPNFLDTIGDLAETIDGGADLLGQMSTLITQGIAARATQLVADGNLDAANELVEGLSDNARFFGVDPEDLEGLEEAFKDTLAGKPGAVEDLNKQLSEGIDGGPPLLDPNGRASQALKGLGLALGVAGLPAQFGDLDDAQIEEQVKLLAETLDLTQEAGSLALQVFGKADSLASLDKLFGRVGVGASAVIAVADTISAVRSLSEGEFGDAAVSGLNAASGVLLLIPGAQVAGVGLAIASFALNSFLANRRQEEAESASEGDALQFLKDRGLEDDFANVFANLNDDKQNIGTFVDQVAEELGLTQDELFEKLNDATGSDREKLLETFGGISAVAEFGGSELPIFGPPITAEDLEDIEFLSEDEREELAAAVNRRREEVVEQVAEIIEPHLD